MTEIEMMIEPDEAIEMETEEVIQNGGGGGTQDYNMLQHLPQVNGVTLKGNKSLQELGITQAIGTEVDTYVQSHKAELKGDPGDTGPRGPQGVPGPAGEPGSKGFSPKAKTQRVENGVLVSITDEEGTTEAIIYDGQGGSSETEYLNKKAVAYGTSITYRSRQTGYIQKVKNMLGLSTYENRGADGNNLAGNGICSLIKEATDLPEFDLLTIEGGTNDFRNSIEIGNLGLIGDTSFNTNTVIGALRDAIEYAISSNPTIKIVLVADPQRDNAGYDVNKENTAGYKLIDYVNAMLKVGNLYGIPVCSWYHQSGLTKLNLATYTSDGLHPNATGYERLGSVLAKNILNSNTIVFFEGGDSPEPVPPGPEPPEPSEDTILYATKIDKLTSFQSAITDLTMDEGFSYFVVGKVSWRTTVVASSKPIKTDSTKTRAVLDAGEYKVYKFGGSSWATETKTSSTSYSASNETLGEAMWFANHDINLYTDDSLAFSKNYNQSDYEA